MDAAFDNEAYLYDTNFSNTGIGKAQRQQVWNLIDKISITSSSSILEVNCGTGEDAKYWLNKTNNYLGTDASSNMIRIAKSKLHHAKFEVCDFDQIHEMNGKFDVIFSNFGGLNCIDYENLTKTILSFSDKLTPNGKIVCVIMGKKCLWDNLFLLLKGKINAIGRRNTNLPIEVNVANYDVKTWYYSPKQLKKIFGLKTLTTKPIGLFVPPSYLAQFFDKHPKFLKPLSKLDSWFKFSFLSNYADHFYIELEKK